MSYEPTKRIWVDAVVDFIDQLGNRRAYGPMAKKGLEGPNDPICCVVVLPYLIPLPKRTRCLCLVSHGSKIQNQKLNTDLSRTKVGGRTKSL